MMYAFLMMAMTLLGGIVRLAQALRLSVPLLYGALVITVFRPWYLTHTAWQMAFSLYWWASWHCPGWCP